MPIDYEKYARVMHAERVKWLPFPPPFEILNKSDGIEIVKCVTAVINAYIADQEKENADAVPVPDRKPYIGAIVLYHLQPHSIHQGPRPAIVTDMDDAAVELQVFGPPSNDYVYPVRYGKGPGQWSWPEIA